MKESKICRSGFETEPSLLKEVLIKTATDAYNERVRQAELSAVQHIEKFETKPKFDLEGYYQDLYLKGHSTK